MQHGKNDNRQLGVWPPHALARTASSTALAFDLLTTGPSALGKLTERMQNSLTIASYYPFEF